jgi:hypothetical protein
LIKFTQYLKKETILNNFEKEFKIEIENNNIIIYPLNKYENISFFRKMIVFHAYLLDKVFLDSMIPLPDSFYLTEGKKKFLSNSYDILNKNTKKTFFMINKKYEKHPMLFQIFIFDILDFFYKEKSNIFSKKDINNLNTFVEISKCYDKLFFKQIFKQLFLLTLFLIVFIYIFFHFVTAMFKNKKDIEKESGVFMIYERKKFSATYLYEIIARKTFFGKYIFNNINFFKPFIICVGIFNFHVTINIFFIIICILIVFIVFFINLIRISMKLSWLNDEVYIDKARELIMFDFLKYHQETIMKLSRDVVISFYTVPKVIFVSTFYVLWPIYIVYLFSALFHMNFIILNEIQIINSKTLNFQILNKLNNSINFFEHDFLKLINNNGKILTKEYDISNKALFDFQHSQQYSLKYTTKIANNRNYTRDNILFHKATVLVPFSEKLFDKNDVWKNSYWNFYTTIDDYIMNDVSEIYQNFLNNSFIAFSDVPLFANSYLEIKKYEKILLYKELIEKGCGFINAYSYKDVSKFVILPVEGGFDRYNTISVLRRGWNIEYDVFKDVLKLKTFSTKNLFFDSMCQERFIQRKVMKFSLRENGIHIG